MNGYTSTRGQVLTLQQPSDAYAFQLGQPLRLARNGDVMHAGLLFRVREWVLGRLRRKVVVTEIDVESGTIRVESKPRWWEWLGRRT